MYNIKFTPTGKKDFESLPNNIQKRVQEKLRSNALLPNPLIRARPLADLPPSTHRFRVGKYRASFYIENKIIFIERLEIRGRAYQR